MFQTMPTIMRKSMPFDLLRLYGLSLALRRTYEIIKENVYYANTA